MVRQKTRSWGGLHKASSAGEVHHPRFITHVAPSHSSSYGEGRFLNHANVGAHSDEEDGEELPPASPGTPPKKVWEQKYRNFLHKRQLRPSPGSSTDSTYSPQPADPSALDGKTFIVPRGLHGAPQFRNGSIVAAPPPPPPCPGSPNNNHRRNSKAHLQTGSGHSKNDGGEDSSVRGGKLFSNMFRKNNSHDMSAGTSRGSTKSLNGDELDVPLRRGVEKAYSPKYKREIAHPTPPAIVTGNSVFLPPLRLASASGSSLDARVPTPSLQRSSPSSNDRMSHSSLQSQESSGWCQHGYQDAFKQHAAEGNYPTGALFLPPDAPEPMLPMPSMIRVRTTSIASVEEDIHEDFIGETAIDGLDMSSRKKAFTEFHNSNNSDSPFLGEDCSFTTAALFLQTPRSKLASAAASHPSHADFTNAAKQSSLVLTPVPENIEITQQRVLRQFVGVDHWKSGRRYLIAPAVLAACPSDTSAPFILSRKRPLMASQAAFARPPVVDECIVLGNCLLSYSMQGNASITAKTWSRASLILRQNYLLEFDQDLYYKGDPRGYAHLCGAKARPHPDFPDSLELDFYGSPCSQADKRSLVIRLADRSERDACVSCLNRAAEMDVKDLYVMDENCDFLGDGNYSTVRRARVRSTNERVALKIFDKNTFWKLVVKGRERADTLVRETSVQATITVRCQNVPSFLQLKGFFETSEKVILELELLEGTDLFRYISMKHGALHEYEAAWILADILKCLICMNFIGAAHRDIKPANVLMCDGSDVSVRGGSTAARVKVCDFGMSTFVGVDGQVRGRCGTPGYVAPEIFTTGLHGGYGNKVDVYSVGVTLYVMLCGYEPFYGETDKELAEANQLSQVEFPKEEWKDVSKDARNLVELLMEKDPERRPSAKDALLHPWFKSHLGERYGELPAVPQKPCDQPSDMELQYQNNSCAIV